MTEISTNITLLFNDYYFRAPYGLHDLHDVFEARPGVLRELCDALTARAKRLRSFELDELTVISVALPLLWPDAPRPSESAHSPTKISSGEGTDSEAGLPRAQALLHRIFVGISAMSDAAHGSAAAADGTTPPPADLSSLMGEGRRCDVDSLVAGFASAAIPACADVASENIFRIYDVDNSGGLGLGELVEFMHASVSFAAAADATAKSVSLRDIDIEAVRRARVLLAELDTDGSGSIEIPEFLHWFTRCANAESKAREAARVALAVAEAEEREAAASAAKRIAIAEAERVETAAHDAAREERELRLRRAPRNVFDVTFAESGAIGMHLRCTSTPLARCFCLRFLRHSS